MEDRISGNTHFRIRSTVEMSGLESVEIVEYGCRGGRGRECARLLFENLKTTDRWVGRFCQSSVLMANQGDNVVLYWFEERCLLICGGIAHLFALTGSRIALQLNLVPVCGHQELIAGTLVAVWDFRRIAIVGPGGCSGLLDCEEGEVENVGLLAVEDRNVVLKVQVRSKWDDELLVIEKRIAPGLAGESSGTPQRL